MNSPKILPWIARKAGITDTMALKLWERAVEEAKSACGYTEGSPKTAEFHRHSIERFLDLVEARVGSTVRQPYSNSTSQVSWVWRHQGRMALFGLTAAQNAAKFWQDTWTNVFTPDLPKRKVGC